jgi:hypothetical protein
VDSLLRGDQVITEGADTSGSLVQFHPAQPLMGRRARARTFRRTIF